MCALVFWLIKYLVLHQLSFCINDGHTQTQRIDATQLELPHPKRQLEEPLQQGIYTVNGWNTSLSCDPTSNKQVARKQTAGNLQRWHQDAVYQWRRNKWK